MSWTDVSQPQTNWKNNVSNDGASILYDDPYSYDFSGILYDGAGNIQSYDWTTLTTAQSGWLSQSLSNEVYVSPGQSMGLLLTITYSESVEVPAITVSWSSQSTLQTGWKEE